VLRFRLMVKRGPYGLKHPVVALTYRATVDVPARFRKSKAVGAVFGLTCSKYQSGEIERSGRISRCGDEMMRVMKVASEPEALLSVLKNPAYRFKRMGLEAGPLSQWLFGALAEAELPVVCVETRHMQAVLKAQINKTDRNDARGIAQMMRVGLYRPVHVKTLRSQKLRMLLTHRKLLQSKAIAIENDLRGTLRNFGLKVGMVGTAKFEARIKETSRTILPVSSTMQTLLSLTDTSSPAKWSMLRFSF
jgi:transposase